MHVPRMHAQLSHLRPMHAEALKLCRAYSLDYAVLFGMMVALALSELAVPYQTYIFSADDQVQFGIYSSTAP